MWIPIRPASKKDTNQQKIKIEFVCQNCKSVAKRYPVLWIDGGNMYWCSTQCYSLWEENENQQPNNTFEGK